MALTQKHRSIAVETPLGEDVLLLRGFTSTEGISRIFHFSLDLLSESATVDLGRLIGQDVNVSIKTADGDTRYWHGIVSRVTQHSGDVGLATYTAEVVPRLWLLTRSADCRIFQQMSVPEILLQVFKDRGIKDVKNQLRASYPPREFCVQYRETDFNFVSRLMEQYGIFYFFEHQEDKHTLVLADGAAVFQPCTGQSEARFQRSLGAAETGADVVTDWQTDQEVRSTRMALTDFNFTTPRVSLDVGIDALAKGPAGRTFEVFDFPGEYETRDAGESLARIRMEEEEAQRLIAHGASTCRRFAPGTRFELTEHYRRDLNKGYVLTSVTHAATEPSYLSGEDRAPVAYSNSFSCLPVGVPFRPVRSAPKPVVQGPQTAVVVGKSGEEIWVDKHGRVKVQFHWDRYGKRDENSSCWLRVSQAWAGKRFGAVFLPRIGQEVLVEFLEGDPDAPIVTGAVYNGEQTPPYDLPAAQTRTTIKSNSSKGGGGSNELRFDDRAGEEQIFVHAQKDLDVIVEKDRRESVGGDRHLTVSGDVLHEVTGAVHAKIGGDVVCDAGANLSANAAQEIYLKAGMKLVIEAGTEITIKAAGSFVKIDPSGVTVQGAMVKINSGGSPGSGSAASPKSPTPPKD